MQALPLFLQLPASRGWGSHWRPWPDRTTYRLSKAIDDVVAPNDDESLDTKVQLQIRNFPRRNHPKCWQLITSALVITQEIMLVTIIRCGIILGNWNLCLRVRRRSWPASWPCSGRIYRAASINSRNEMLKYIHTKIYSFNLNHKIKLVQNIIL